MADKLNALFVVMNGSHAMQANFNLNSYELAVLIAVANRGNTVTGECWASISLLAHDMAISRRSVERANLRLIKLELLQYLGEGRNGVNRCRVNVGLIQQVTADYKAKLTTDANDSNDASSGHMRLGDAGGAPNSANDASSGRTILPLIHPTDPPKKNNQQTPAGEGRSKSNPVEPKATPTSLASHIDQSNPDQSNLNSGQLQPTNRLKPCRELDPGDTQSAEQLCDLWNEYDPAPPGKKMGRYIDFEIMLADGHRPGILRSIMEWVFTKSKRKDHPRDWGHPGVLQGSAGFRVAFEEIYKQYQRYQGKNPESAIHKNAAAARARVRAIHAVHDNKMCTKCGKCEAWPGQNVCVGCEVSDQDLPLSTREITLGLGAQRVVSA
jgi:ferredoxin